LHGRAAKRGHAEGLHRPGAAGGHGHE
jgi:hypothetical protein